MITDRPDTKTTDKLVITELFNAFVAFLFAASAPVAIILSVALGGGLDEAQVDLVHVRPDRLAVKLGLWIVKWLGRVGLGWDEWGWDWLDLT